MLHLFYQTRLQVARAEARGTQLSRSSRFGHKLGSGAELLNADRNSNHCNALESMQRLTIGRGWSPHQASKGAMESFQAGLQ